jgi:PiT family inorganic phosphate transporter
VVIGAVIGVGLAKKGRGINFRVLAKIGVGWLTAPVAACSISFVALFIVQNVFEQKVVHLVPYRISGDVVEVLATEGLPTAPLADLVDRPFLGSSVFRKALRSEHQWTENQLVLIFAYSELDTLQVDSTIVKKSLESLPLTGSQFDAVKKLQGQVFVHKWQLDRALASLSDEWKPQYGRGSDLFNKSLRQKHAALDAALKKPPF